MGGGRRVGPNSTCLLPVLYVAVCMGGGRTGRSGGDGMGGSSSLYGGRLTGASFGRGGGRSGIYSDGPVGKTGHSEVDGRAGRGLFPSAFIPRLAELALGGIELEVEDILYNGRTPDDADDGIEGRNATALTFSQPKSDPRGVEGSLAKSPDDF